jgi:hypothetical protein
MNIDERSHQVGLIDRIYFQAQSVRLRFWDHFHEYRRFFRWLVTEFTENMVEIEAWPSRKVG